MLTSGPPGRSTELAAESDLSIRDATIVTEGHQTAEVGAPQFGAPRRLNPTCDVSKINNAITKADYSSCAGASSGDTCTPTCLAGYAPTSPATGFTLECGVDGSFDGTDATLACPIEGEQVSGT